MGKTNVIIRHVNENDKYNATKCPWHSERNCFFLLYNSKKFHCLFTLESKQWFPNETTGSCDVPEEVHDLIVLHRELGDDYVLPFTFPFRERSGYAIALFELQREYYGPNSITVQNLAETYYAAVVFLCAECRRLGGAPPVFKWSTFLYADNHPVLASVGAGNSDKRNRDGNRELFSKKKWNRFLRKKTCIVITRYFRNVRPDLFRKKFGSKNKCLLHEDGMFNDETHRLICRSKRCSLAQVLENFIHLMKNDRIKCIILKWIEESKVAT